MSLPLTALTSAADAAWPATPHAVAPTERATVATAARIAGMAWSAAVVPGDPAARSTRNSSVRPSGLMNWAVDR